MQRLNLTVDELSILRELLLRSRRKEPAKAPVFDSLELKIANALLDAMNRETESYNRQALKDIKNEDD